MGNEFIGHGSVIKLKEILAKHNPSKVFLVTGKSSYPLCGAKEIIEPMLGSFIQFNEFEVNPKIEDVQKGIELFKENNCDFVVAVGGGSVLDIAKAINVLAFNSDSVLNYLSKKSVISNKGKVLVAIPTTSGTGSEVTRYSVIYDGKAKVSLSHEFLIPDYAIVDTQFTMNLPSYITACTGMDALCQSIESYWAVASTEESKKYAKESIKLILNSLFDSVNNPSLVSRERLSRGSYLSGKAINISRTTACHSVSYPITTYFGVPHGHAVALTLAELLKYSFNVSNEDVLDKRGVDYVKRTILDIVEMLGKLSLDDACNKINDLMKSIGLTTRLIELGIKSNSDIELIIKNGFNPDRVTNNPRKLTTESLRLILHRIM